MPRAKRGGKVKSQEPKPEDAPADTTNVEEQETPNPETEGTTAAPEEAELLQGSGDEGDLQGEGCLEGDDSILEGDGEPEGDADMNVNGSGGDGQNQEEKPNEGAVTEVKGEDQEAGEEDAVAEEGGEGAVNGDGADKKEGETEGTAEDGKEATSTGDGDSTSKKKDGVHSGDVADFHNALTKERVMLRIVFYPVTFEDLQTPELSEILKMAGGFKYTMYKQGPDHVSHVGFVDMHMLSIVDAISAKERLANLELGKDKGTKLTVQQGYKGSELTELCRKCRDATFVGKLDPYCTQNFKARQFVEKVACAKNLPEDVTVEMLLEKFASGVKILLPRDDAGKTLGHAYLEFPTIEDKQKGIKEHSKTKLGESTIDVSFLKKFHLSQGATDGSKKGGKPQDQKRTPTAQKRHATSSPGRSEPNRKKPALTHQRGSQQQRGQNRNNQSNQRRSSGQYQQQWSQRSPANRNSGQRSMYNQHNRSYSGDNSGMYNQRSLMREPAAPVQQPGLTSNAAMELLDTLTSLVSGNNSMGALGSGNRQMGYNQSQGVSSGGYNDGQSSWGGQSSDLTGSYGSQSSNYGGSYNMGSQSSLSSMGGNQSYMGNTGSQGSYGNLSNQSTYGNQGYQSSYGSGSQSSYGGQGNQSSYGNRSNQGSSGYQSSRKSGGNRQNKGRQRGRQSYGN